MYIYIDDVHLYSPYPILRTPSSDLWPVVSTITCSGTPLWRFGTTAWRNFAWESGLWNAPQMLPLPWFSSLHFLTFLFPCHWRLLKPTPICDDLLVIPNFLRTWSRTQMRMSVLFNLCSPKERKTRKPLVVRLNMALEKPKFHFIQCTRGTRAVRYVVTDTSSEESSIQLQCAYTLSKLPFATRNDQLQCVYTMQILFTLTLQ